MSWWKQKQFCFKSDNAEHDAGPCGQYVSCLVKFSHLCELRDPRRTLRCSGHQRWWAGLRGSGWGGPGAEGPSLYEEPEWSSHSGGTCIHHPAAKKRYISTADGCGRFMIINNPSTTSWVLHEQKWCKSLFFNAELPQTNWRGQSTFRFLLLVNQLFAWRMGLFHSVIKRRNL